MTGGGSVFYELWVHPGDEEEAAQIAEKHSPATVELGDSPRSTLGEHLERQLHVPVRNAWFRGTRTFPPGWVYESASP
jgi:hypothetical protein